MFLEKLSLCENKQTEELAEVRRQLDKLTGSQCKGHSLENQTEVLSEL